jgi:DNA-binding response OmpR family regulator
MTYVINPVAVSASPLAMDGRRTRHLNQNKPSAHPIRCLVVDDDQTILKCLAYMLAMLGFQGVETTQRQPEVMTKLIAGPYQLLITDLEMPDINVCHLTQTIKKNAHETKVIIMTGRPKDDCLEMMASQWVDGWLFKPFGLRQLGSMLSLLGVGI